MNWNPPPYAQDYANLIPDERFGWECPRCHKCYSPTTEVCTTCEAFYEEASETFFVSPDDVNLTPNQIREVQDALRAIGEDLGWKHKIIVLPPRSAVRSERRV